jgi:hypothetical protein
MEGHDGSGNGYTVELGVVSALAHSCSALLSSSGLQLLPPSMDYPPTDSLSLEDG